MLRIVTEWPSHQVINSLSDQVTEWPSDQVTKWPIEWLTEWLSDRKLLRRLTVWYIFKLDGYLNPMKVVLHPAELRAPWEQEDHPDDHHADLVQHCLGRGGQILGHNHSCTESILLMKYYSMDSVFKDLHSWRMQRRPWRPRSTQATNSVSHQISSWMHQLHPPFY